MPQPENSLVSEKNRDSTDTEHNNYKNFLSVELSKSGFSYCVLDTNYFRYTALESFAFTRVDSYLELADIAEQLVKNNKRLTQSYQRISIVYNSTKCTLIPSSLFSYSEKEIFIDFNTYPSEDFEIKVDKLHNLAAYSVYPFPKILSEKINFLFPRCRVRHISTSLIENVLYMVRHQSLELNMALHVQSDHFEVLIFKDNNLEFYNSFNYQTVDDLFYYLFFVLEQLRLEPEKMDTLLLGEVSLSSQLYKSARLYFNSLTLAPRTDLYKYSREFDDIPHHYFYNLLNLNACG